MAKVNKRHSDEPLKEADLVELECVAYNSKPPANITWFNGPEPIEPLDSAAGSTASQATMANNWQAQPKLRRKRLLQRSQIEQSNDGQTFNTHSFLSIKLSRHEHKAQISCQAHNGPMRQPMIKGLELQVQRE